MTTTIDLDRLKIETRAYLALLRDLLPTLEVLVEQEEAGGKETSAPASAPGPWRSWHGLHSMVADAVSSDPLRPGVARVDPLGDRRPPGARSSLPRWWTRPPTFRLRPSS